MRSTAAAPVPSLLDLSRELEGLRRRVEVLEARTPAPLDAAWLLTVATATRGHVFSVSELYDHAVVDPTLRLALRGLTPQRVGKRLQTLAARPVESGVRVESCGRDEDGALWRIA